MNSAATIAMPNRYASFGSGSPQAAADTMPTATAGLSQGDVAPVSPPDSGLVAPAVDAALALEEVK